MLAVTEDTFSPVVEAASQPTLVHFWAPWCGLCRLVVPSLVQCQQVWDGRLQIASVNADENFKLATRFRLTSLPTLILFDRGQVRLRIEGICGRDELHRSLEQVLTALALPHPVR